MRRYVAVLFVLACAGVAFWGLRPSAPCDADGADAPRESAAGDAETDAPCEARLTGREPPPKLRAAPAAKVPAATAVVPAKDEGPKQAETIARMAAIRARIPIERRISDTQRLLDRSANAADRAAMDRLLRRFLTGKDGSGHWTDRPLGALSKTRASRAVAADALPIADEEESERRRLEQLENLQKRDAVGLLDAIEASLAWLAIHQGTDGSFSDLSAQARCTELAHDPKCTNERSDLRGAYATAATGLAVLAFLDFRDQDVRALFEPSLAGGIAWLLKQQRPDGSFQGQGQLYTSAIALMAIAAAAASSGREDLKEAATRGLDCFARNPGRLGGFRYGFGLDGDLSVSAWVAQAVEQSRLAQLHVPWRLEEALRGFLTSVWQGGPKFSYVSGGGRSWWLTPAGMLTGLILWEPEPERDAAWNQWLAKPEWKSRPPLYSLYYGVRLAIRANGNIPDPWRKWVFEISNLQIKEGNASGAFPEKLDGPNGANWFDRAGPTVRTAFAALTMEHALYLR